MGDQLASFLANTEAKTSSMKSLKEIEDEMNSCKTQEEAVAMEARKAEEAKNQATRQLDAMMKMVSQHQKKAEQAERDQKDLTEEANAMKKLGEELQKEKDKKDAEYEKFLKEK